MADFKFGQKVGVNVGDEDKVGFVVGDGPYQNEQDETKYDVQIGQKIFKNIGYREPSDRQGAGAGDTFWPI